MKWFQTLGFRKIWLYFSTTYILFVLIPVVVLNVAAGRAIRITEENAMRTNMTVLSESCSLIDTKLRTIDSISTQILMNDTLLDLQFIGKNKQPGDYYRIWQASENFRRMVFLDSELGAMIYYKGSDIFISPSYLSNGLEQDYGKLYQFGEYSYEAFRAQLQSQGLGRVFFPSLSVTANGKTSRGILYAMRLSAWPDEEKRATVYFMLSDAMLSELFAPILEAGGSVLLLDSQNELLFSSGGSAFDLGAALSINEREGRLDERYFGPDNIANYVLSNYGIKYVTVMPRAVVLQEVNGLRALSIYLNVAAVLLAVGYGFFLAFRNSKRLSGVLESAQSLTSYQGGNVFDYLSSAMLQLASNNRSLRSSAEAQLPILRVAFLDKLVSGSFTGEEEFRELAARLGIDEQGRYCLLALSLEEEGNPGAGAGLSVESIGHFVEKKQLALEALAQTFAGRGMLYSRSMDQVVLLLRFSGEEAADYRRIAEELMRRSVDAIYRQAGLQLRCVGSGIFEELRAAYQGYNLCRDLFLSYSFSGMENGVILWDGTDVAVNGSLFIYPPELEGKLLRQIKAGEAGGALESVALLFHRNFVERTLSPGMSSLFVEQLKITLLKVLDPRTENSGEEKLILALGAQKTAASLQAAVCEIVRGLCGAYASRDSARTESMRQEIVTFVDEHFSDANLSLKFTADRFSLSEAYFSLLFKELAGENFSVYLDRLRMESAHALLKDTTLKVDDVALRCGYAAAGTFRRAYKRYYGVSPTQGRRL